MDKISGLFFELCFSYFEYENPILFFTMYDGYSATVEPML
jgi:hypothetical protein